MAQSPNVQTLEQTVHQTNNWIISLSETLGSDEETAFRGLRGYLHTLRDCLDVGEASDFAAQLPMLVRGVYYTGWDPSRTPQQLNRDEFLDRLSHHAALRDEDPPADDVAKAVSALLATYMTEGQLTDVVSQLRDDVRELIAL